MLLELVWTRPARLHPIRWLVEAGDTGYEAPEPGPTPAQYVNVPVTEQQIQDAVGDVGVTQRYDVAASGTWIIPHGLGRRPLVQIYLASGEQVTADIAVDETYITVVFAVPTAGFVLAY